MERIIIIGAGFAGMAAAKKLKAEKKALEVVLIDKKAHADFLPLLPDTIGRRIKSGNLEYATDKFCLKEGVKFINSRVESIDLEKKQIFISGQQLAYDYLIIASGSETNFYGNDNIREHAYKLNSVEDAQLLMAALKQKSFAYFIICGGGYTGVEVATNLRQYLKKTNKEARIIIVERSGSILGPLPGWMKEYTLQNLKRLSIELVLNSSIEKTDGERVFLASGTVMERALVIWSAGVKTAKFIQDLKIEKSPQGRIKVDENLKFSPDCFAAGDAADFTFRGVNLRMAVQFSIVEGCLAAENIARCIKKKPLRPYRPRDLGFIIPMANNRSCGVVFGVKLKGLFPTFLHYLMCIYRSVGLRNKLALIGNLVIGEAKK
ncbi:MAG: FAD-dependent oxidoreductase [Candidatus Omnitrophica bacterium]|nr:FAD-dependent oxidoreductase [Candidatus Omnitrophota bacterium]MDD5653285.1 FAD-dependent oxidoreductase [Candidatus Omnitrophota bacterium]